MTSTVSSRDRVAGLLVVLFVFAACGGSSEGDTPEADAETTASDAEGGTGDPTSLHCIKENATTEVIDFDSDGVNIRGAITGSGTTGIVFGHQFGGDACQWWKIPGGFMQELAKDHLVMVFDFRGTGESQTPDDATSSWALDVVAAAEQLREHGAEHIILAGASAGGSAVIEAAPEIEDLTGLVGLSAAMEFYAADPQSAISDIDEPVLFMVDKNDGDFYGPLKKAFDQLPSKDKEFVSDGMAGHGVAMIRFKEPREQLLDWIDDHTV